jgi:hypothetical protein
MQIKRYLSFDLTVLALAAVLWQAEASAQTSQAKEARPRSKGVGDRNQNSENRCSQTQTPADL